MLGYCRYMTSFVSIVSENMETRMVACASRTSFLSLDTAPVTNLARDTDIKQINQLLDCNSQVPLVEVYCHSATTSAQVIKSNTPRICPFPLALLVPIQSPSNPFRI